jgi:signal transduction histidine kinase
MLPIPANPALRALLHAAWFVPAYMVLDWVSYIHPLTPFNITTWNPQPALAVILVMLGGSANFFAILAGVFLADVAFRGAPGGYAFTVLGAVVLAAGYTAIGFLLRRLVRDAGLRALNDLVAFCVVASMGTAAVALAFVSLLDAFQHLSGTGFVRAWLRFWIGDFVGILVTAPFLLVAADADRRRTFVAMLRSGEAWLQTAVLVAVVWMMFAIYRENAARLFYLLFIPLVWASMRWGMVGAIAAAGVAQVGVLLGMESRATALPALELQALVAAFTITGLFLGVSVDERRASDEQLKRSLHLAAAGEMAGAIAHELNQPLTALTVYGESVERLLETGADVARVRPVLASMLHDVKRTGEVTRRLRDLFKAGSTQLEAVAGDELLAAARRIGESIVRAAPVALEVGESPGGLTLYIDRLQVEIVLRNLLANSAESLVAAKTPDARIRVELRAHGRDMALVAVGDNGPGIPASMRARLFQPFSSGKAVGMGVGLAVSRAIAEAHGGSLDAADGPHAEFHLVLPCLPIA